MIKEEQLSAWEQLASAGQMFSGGFAPREIAIEKLCGEVRRQRAEIERLKEDSPLLDDPKIREIRQRAIESYPPGIIKDINALLGMLRRYGNSNHIALQKISELQALLADKGAA